MFKVNKQAKSKFRKGQQVTYDNAAGVFTVVSKDITAQGGVDYVISNGVNVYSFVREKDLNKI